MDHHEHVQGTGMKPASKRWSWPRAALVVAVASLLGWMLILGVLSFVLR